MEDKRVKQQPKKHLWKPEEDLILKKYVETHGEGNWASVSKKTGLMRGGKSCRLRWKNYLRPNIKRGAMSQEEEDLIIRMHKLLGNRWSLIAGRLPGRTDNEVKNYWNTHLNKRCSRAKRKLSDATDNPTDNHNSETKSKRKRAKDSQPVTVESQKSSTDRLEERKSEDNNSNLLNPSTGNTRSFNYDPMFIFEDQPFVTYMDSFLFFEAFGCTATGESCAEIGMQSVIP